MLRYIIRLDDACPSMNKGRWSLLENILDEHGIKPIVGVIPDSQDRLFTWKEDPTFWLRTVQQWKDKGWTIAQHGCHHTFHDIKKGIHSEFVGLDYASQKELIDKGYEIMLAHDCRPTCFFAPAHSFDNVTVNVIYDSGYFEFISDGYAIYPYVEQNMLFLPRIFDSPHKILSFGVYTFVIHPNFVTDKELARLQVFIEKYHDFFKPVSEILNDIKRERKRTLIERAIQPSINTIRKVRKIC